MAQAHVRIIVPARSAASSHARRKPSYVSPSTASIVIQLESVNGVPENPVTSQEVDLTASNTADCSPPTALSPLTCTVPISAPPGTDVLTLTTYDQTGGTGSVLSVNSVSATIQEGGTNQISVTLAGVPVSVGTEPVSGLTTTGSNAYTMTAGTAELLVTPLDADANVIVGPGAPQLSITSVSATNVTAAFATATTTHPNPNPNLVNLTKSYGSATTVTVNFSAVPPQNASPPTDTGAGSGVTGSFSVLAPLDIYVASGSSVQEFVPPSTTAAGTANPGAAVTAVAYDAAGEVFALVPGENSVFRWNGGPTFPSSQVTYGTGEVPVAMAVASNGGLAFLNYGGSLNLAYFPPDDTSYTQFYYGFDSTHSGPISAGFLPDSTTLYIADDAGIDEVQNLPTSPSGTRVSSTYTSGQLATDGLGNVFIVSGSSVLAFTPPNFTTAVATYAAANTGCTSDTFSSLTFAVGSGTSLANEPVVIEAAYSSGCYAYASYPSAVSGSIPSTFASNPAALYVSPGGTIFLGASTNAIDAYSTLWGTASYSASAASGVTAITAF
jgi:hypothetical protein